MGLLTEMQVDKPLNKSCKIKCTGILIDDTAKHRCCEEGACDKPVPPDLSEVTSGWKIVYVGLLIMREYE